jgi:hypothetical protein
VSREQRQLRFIQVGCSLLVLVCVAVGHLSRYQERTATVTVQSVIVVAAIWSAVGGLSAQRKLQKAPRRVQPDGKTTPFSRWRAGHLVRLCAASSVALWGLILSEFGGSLFIADLLFGLGLLLLLVWRPDEAPSRMTE